MKSLIPKSAKVVAVDTECSGLYPDEGAFVASVAVAWRGGSKAFPFWHQEGKDAHNLGSAEFDQLLTELSTRDIVMHNANYDVVMLNAGYPMAAGIDLTDRVIWDTMLCSRVLEPTKSAALDDVAKRLGLGGKVGLEPLLGYLKENKLKKYRYDLAPWEIVKPYITADAEETLAVYEKQHEYASFHACPAGMSALHQSNFLREIELEMDFCRTLTQMELRGIGYDAKKSSEIAKQLTEFADKLEATMPFGCGINEAKAYFFDEVGLKPDRITEKNAPSLDKEQVRDWALDGVLWAQEYKEVTWARRACGRWYAGYVEKLGVDGRLRVRYSQGTVVSGRLSAKRVNLQALPLSDKIEQDVPGPRELIRAKSGHELWSLDMSQAELRIGAKYAQCQRLIDMLEAGVDYHAVTTENVLGVSPEDPEWKNKRTIGKKLNFASLYGIGPEAFQRLLSREAGIHISLAEATELVYGWRAFWPEFGRAYNAGKRAFRERGWVKILLGSEYETRSYMQAQDWEETGWNRVVQGSLAAWMRLWLPEVEREYPGRLVLTVHDSIVLELPKGQSKHIVALLASRAEERASKIFEIKMPVDAERL
jgi:DNA polymerase I-like protein with 3'-5' exonuclease and polymerase domains